MPKILDQPSELNIKEISNDKLSETIENIDELEKQSNKNDHRRRERLKACVHWCNVILIGSLYLVVIASVVVLCWHWLSPWNFLSSSQLDTIKNILFSALATNLAKDFIKNFQ
jgi:hypothetical protein